LLQPGSAAVKETVACPANMRYASDAMRRLIGLFILVLPSVAGADVKHVIARGHTVDAISRRYHVPVKVILDTNHIKDPRHLKVGDVLVIPGVTPPPGSATTAPAAAKVEPKKDNKPKAPPTYAAKAKTPGTVHLLRLATAEDFTLKVGDRRGRIPPPTMKSFEHVLRYPSGQTHPIEPRLVALLGIVSDHFGSRKIDVISGFRPYSPTQYTAHSNHNVGHAVDFRVEGVPNEAVRDYCRTLRNVGVGYYPNSTFVHLDARATSAFWIDYSKPGEPPKYNAPNLDADESASDVSSEVHLSGANPDPNAPVSNPTPPPDDPPPSNP
jgi:uncharacterized protein YcbK (DUF882 family)